MSRNSCALDTTIVAFQHKYPTSECGNPERGDFVQAECFMILCVNSVQTRLGRHSFR